MEFAPRVRPASHFVDCAAFEQCVEAGVCIGLQYAIEFGQVGLRKDALTVVRLGEPVVANIV